MALKVILESPKSLIIRGDVLASREGAPDPRSVEPVDLRGGVDASGYRTVTDPSDWWCMQARGSQGMSHGDCK